MLKGKSKIQLFDAKSGIKQAEFENKNLITNAVSKILNTDDSAGLWRHAQSYYGTTENYGTDSSFNPLKTACPLSTNTLGGVFLFGDAITENANTLMPPANTEVIGYAGGNYSSNDTYRGAYNTNESGVITDDQGNVTGYRHVWDFATDKANGTIKCLGLTSQHGGNFGLKANLSGETIPPYTYGYFGGANTYVTPNFNTNVAKFTSTNRGSVLHIAKNANGTVTLIKRGITDNTKIYKVTLRPTSQIKLTAAYNEVIEDTVLISGVAQYARAYVYNNVIHEILATGGSTTITHKTYSLAGALLNTVTVTAPSAVFVNMSAPNMPFYFNGYYYYTPATATTTLVKCTAAGEQISQITIPDTTKPYLAGVHINEGLNQAEIFYRETGSYVTTNSLCILAPDDTMSIVCGYNDVGTATALGGNYMQFISSDPTEPFAYLAYGYTTNTSAESYNDIVCLLDMRYLASINNLATAVTKTSAQVMKVTYELTEA